MSDKHTSWYHCGRCGSMFQSTAGEASDRLCTACGRNPALGIGTQSSASSAAPMVAAAAEEPSTDLDRSRLPSRRRKSNYFFVKLIAGWLLFLIAVIFSARLFWPNNERKSKPVVSLATSPYKTASQDSILLSQAHPFYNRTLGRFLSSGTPEERNQFVVNPIATAAKMARFYSLNSPISIDPKTLSLAADAVVHFPSGPAIETQWRTSDNHSLDAVFIEKNGDWQLDWDHFARHSDFPWPLFLAGSGDDSGTFRLLARERLAAERKDEASISIVFYAPKFAQSDDAASQSPEFLIPRNTANGRLLDAAFKLERSGQRPFGVKLKSIDSEGLIRVRVKVHRVQENLERRFVLDEIVSCHWYSNDAAGVEITGNPAK